MIFTCPVCSADLSAQGTAYRCADRHSFDLAKEGYLNLLLAQQRRSADPGYSKEMIAGRRDFFDAGHYERLADGVASAVLRQLPDGGRRPVVLDAGCGEGYYLRRLRDTAARQGREIDRAGLDISKHGVRVAARRDQDGDYAVAGSFRMPVRADSVDLLLTHFSPVSPVDFGRVVRPGGIVIIGGPGVDHLYEFKQLLYDRPERFDPSDPLADVDGFRPVGTETVEYRMSLDQPGQLAQLLSMTPYYWSVDPATRERIAGLDGMEITVQVDLRSYRVA